MCGISSEEDSAVAIARRNAVMKTKPREPCGMCYRSVTGGREFVEELLEEFDRGLVASGDLTCLASCDNPGQATWEREET